MTETLTAAAPGGPHPARDGEDNASPRMPVAADVRARLAPAMPSARTSWLVTLVVVAIGAALRLVYLTRPHGDGVPWIFDEVYYHKDAHDLITAGHALNNDLNGPGFVVHPPLAKWIIGVFELGLGDHPLAWRLPAAIAGILTVALLTRIGIRMFRSTVLGGVAGLLLALDGLHLVLSRTGLLDIFLVLFVTASFGCLLVGRDCRRRSILDALERGEDLTDRLPPRRRGSAPWWYLAAGILAGCATSVKWSGAYFVVVFALLYLFWETGARRAAGTKHPVRDTLLDELGWMFAFGGFSLLVYLLSWTGWFVTGNGWDRNWAADAGHHLPWGINALVNLGKYHIEALQFHAHLDTPHPYQSTPWSWLLLGRPVAFAYSDQGPCGAPKCSTETLLLGTPLLWWSFIPAIVLALWLWIAKRDWRMGSALLAAAAGIVPWLAFPDRTMFLFYAAPSEPFLILLVTGALGLVLGSSSAARPRRLLGAVLVAGYVLLVGACLWFFWPILTSEPISYHAWQMRMWLDSWV